MKKFLLIFYVFLSTTIVWSQDGQLLEKAQRLDIISTIFPVSPETAGLGKYGEVPVHEATGRINYAAPLYTIKVADFEWPIYLSYNYSGLLVEEDPPMTGLGWTLIADGRIGVIMRGLPDYGHAGYVTGFGKQYIVPYLSGAWDNLPDNKKREKIFTLNSYVSNFGGDGLPDIYSVSANNLSGKFCFDENGKVVFVAGRNYRINFDKELPAFTVTDEKGITYIFSERELTYANFKGEEYKEPTTFYTMPSYVSSWLLSRIILPNGKGEISFAYQSTKYRKEKKSDYAKICGKVYGGGQRFNLNNYATVAITAKVLKKITFPAGSVEFTIDKRGTEENIDNVTLKRIDVFSKNRSHIVGYDFTYHNPYYNNRKKVIKSIKKRGETTTLDWYNFEYYDLDLLSRTIPYTAQDYYGFYNGRTNNYLSDMDADRSVNFSTTVIGALKKITYPTKGSTTIFYEPNTIKKNRPVNCSYDFSKTFGCSFEFHAKKNIDTILNIYGNNVKQDFEIVKAHAEVLVKNEYGLHPSGKWGYVKILGGQKEIQVCNAIKPLHLLITPEDLNNPWFGIKVGHIKNGQVRLKAKADESIEDTLICNLVIEHSDIKNPTAGGIRVARTQSIDENGHETNRYYKYTLEDGQTSSGIQSYQINFYEKTIITGRTLEGPPPIDSDGTCIIECPRIKIIRPLSIIPFVSYQGAPVLYERVEISEDNNGKKGKIVREFSTSGDPLPPYLAKDWEKAKLLRESLFAFSKGKFRKIQETVYSYYSFFPYGEFWSNSTHRSLGINVEKGFFLYFCKRGYVLIGFYGDKFDLVPEAYLPVKKTTKQYHENGTVATQEVYAYTSPYLHSKSIGISSSKNENLTKKFFYPYSNHTLNQALVNANRIAAPVQAETYRNSKLLNKQHTTYGSYHGGSIIEPKSVQVTKGSHAAETRITYDRYDTQGNLLQYTPADGLTTSILWGYGGQYPVAKVEDATYDAAIAKLTTDEQTAIQNGSYNDDQLRTVLNKLRSLDAMVTTYTFKPLVGMTSATGPDGKTVYYEYDAFNRLKTTMDDKHNILKEIEYHYKGQ